MQNDAPTNGAAVSDQARAGGQLPSQFSSPATAAAPNTNQPIPAAATAYPSEAQVQAQTAQLQAQQPPAVPSPVVTAPQPQLPPAQPQNPVTTTQSMAQPPAGIPQRASAPAQPGAPAGDYGALDAKVNAIGDQVQNLSTILATFISSQQPATPAAGQSVNGTNTGNQLPVMPGVGAPMAPTPHLPSNPVVAKAPDPNQPVIPKPDPNNPGGTGEGVRVYVETEEDRALNDYDWIEKHFRLRDLSVDQMALALRWDPAEVITVLKDRGYQFPDGV